MHLYFSSLPTNTSISSIRDNFSFSGNFRTNENHFAAISTFSHFIEIICTHVYQHTPTHPKRKAKAKPRLHAGRGYGQTNADQRSVSDRYSMGFNSTQTPQLMPKRRLPLTSSSMILQIFA